MNISNIAKLIISFSLPLLAGFSGSLFTITGTGSWYEALAKPFLNPPSWVFGPVWTMLYILMGAAAFLIWKRGWDRKSVRYALGIFIIQLLLNTLWSIMFFGLQSPQWALVTIILLLIFIVITMVSFYRIERWAMYLLIPYILWVSFASYLNVAIWVLN